MQLPADALVARSTAVIGIDAPSSTIAEAIATMASTTIDAAAAATSTDAASSPDENMGECRLMGGFALIVQAALGALALLSLVYKRWRERPQRPVKIWFFDVSKQVFGSVLVHIANVFMSMLTSGRFDVEPVKKPGRLMLRDDDDYTPNPCSFYLLNLAIDTTIGIPILIILLKVFTGLVAYTPLGKPRESIQSGYYGDPPNAWWWLKQSIIYFCGLFGMKICVLIIFLILPWISKIGDWALRWTEGNEELQIAFVMMIFPLIMNALQYYIIDSFIKQNENTSPSGHERLDSEDPNERHRLHRDEPDDDGEELLTDSDLEDDEDPKVPTPKARETRRPAATDAAKDAEYDPQRDGEAGTIVGSSSSSNRGEPDKVIQPGMLPKE